MLGAHLGAGEGQLLEYLEDKLSDWHFNVSMAQHTNGYNTRTHLTNL